MSHHIVRAADAPSGDRGETLLVEAGGTRLRVWEGEPAGESAPEHRNDYDLLAYVVRGRLRVRVGDEGPDEVGPGDAFRVAAGEPWGFEVVETATVVEAVVGG